MIFERETQRVVELNAMDAQLLLLQNTHNRPISKSDVRKWAAEMQNGRWLYNGEAIKIAQDGTILDGQHRLTALAQSPGVTIRTLVVTGLRAEAQATMDQGTKRCLADQIVLSGREISKIEASALKTFVRWDRNLLFSDNKRVSAILTTTAMVEYANQNPHILGLLRHGMDYRKIRGARDGIVVAAFAMVASVNDTQVASEFFQSVLDGIGLQAGSPVLALRNWLDRATTLRISDRDALGAILVAFGHWIQGNSIARIQRPSGGTYTADTFPDIYAL